MTLERKECSAEKAIKKMAAFLDKGERPLALISDSYDRQELAKHLKNQRLGSSLVLAGSLLAAADYEQDISLAALTYVNDHYLLAKNVASMRLLVQIYSLRRNQKKEFKFPFASSASFRDIVLEIEQTGKGLRETEAPTKGNPYYEELRFVRCIWDSYMQDKHDKRTERLKKYAKKMQEANTPVAYLHWGDPDKQIMAFLEECDPALVVEAELDSKAKKLEDCFSGRGTVKELEDCKSESGKTKRKEPMAYEAQTLEEAAWASRKMLLQWLNEHKQDDDIIGIIDYDRVLIRRLHSLLMQKDGIFLQETTGWPANNLLVGKALLALASGAPRTELISRLQNVIVRKQGNKWARLPRDLAKGGIDHNWQKEVDGLTDILDSFTKENSHSKSSPGSISDWFGAMAKEAETGFLKEFFEQDAAGQDLRPLLHMLADEFAELKHGKDEEYDGREVGRLLFDSLSSIDLNSSNNDSRVQLVPPGRFTTRKFKAMLLAGADADTLPSSRAPQLLSDDARNKYLGLPTREEQIEKRRKSTALLLGNSCEVGAVWCGQAGISPYIDLMSKETKLLRRLELPWENKEQPKPLDGREVKVKLQEAPKKISVSACVELLACPYRYHARSILKLKKDAPATIGQPSKYGTFVHEILEKFHNHLKDQGFSSVENAKKRLENFLKNARDGKNGGKSQSDKMSEAERRYFAWQFEHYRERYVAEIKKLFDGEQFKGVEAVEVELGGELTAGIQITGKADRIDCYGEEGYAVIDVKTGSIKKYGDYKTYPQLPLYMKLFKDSGKTICSNHSKFWVLSLKEGTNRVSRIPNPNEKDGGQDIEKNAPDQVFARYQKIFTDALEGEKMPLPANGVQSVCQYCEYGGLCRKKHWRNDKKKDEAS